MNGENKTVLTLEIPNTQVVMGKNEGGYAAMVKLEPYLFEAWYETLDYENAYMHYMQEASGETPAFACSSLRRGKMFGRNLDWKYSTEAEFLIHVPASSGRYASIGVAGGFSSLSDEFVTSGERSELYKLVPFQTRDGINEYGVTVSVNVVPIDNGENYAVPTGRVEAVVSGLMLNRYVLDHFQTAADAVSFIKEHMVVYFSNRYHEMGYEFHYMIADETNTYLLEFSANAAVVIDMTDGADSPLAGKAYMTNFPLYGVVLNEDGTVYTPQTQTDTENAEATNHITENGSGLERYNLIAQHYDGADTKDGMRALLDALKYTRTYSTSDAPANPFWYTESVGVNGLSVSSPYTDFEPVVEYEGQMFVRRQRNEEPATWQTVHSSIYDIAARKIFIIVQENGIEIERGLNSD